VQYEFQAPLAERRFLLTVSFTCIEFLFDLKYDENSENMHERTLKNRI
jgi:hypothetical protein